MESSGMIRVVKNVGKVFSRNSPSILTGISVAGLVTTTILGIKATPKALSIIDDHVWTLYENEVRDPEKTPFVKWLGLEEGDGYSWRDKANILSRKELVKLTWKVYLPTVAVGFVTIVCIISANHISLRRNAALASIYGITEAAFKEYQAKVVETIGKNKELKIRDDISADQVKRNPPGTNEVVFTGKGPVMCYDSLSGRYFKSDIEKIRKAVNDLNFDLMNEMFVSLNEFYYALGLSGTSLGDQMGWSLDREGKIEIQYSAQLVEEGEPCLVLNYSVEPRFMK